jgi:hypothetical protein
MRPLLHVRTVILSDVHLGTPDCKIEEVNHFLRHVRCERLILNGDIIDGWQLTRSGHWTKAHTRFVRIVLKKLEKRDTEVIYLRGNHDDILASFLPLDFENLRIVEEYVHDGLRGRYLATFSTRSPEISSFLLTWVTGATARFCASTGSTTAGEPGAARSIGRSAKRSRHG